MPNRPPSILIVGAGPSGLTAALELARRGVPARIIDKDPGPTTLSKAVGINPRSLEILAPSGATERLLEHGVRMRAVQIRYQDRPLAALRLSRLAHRFNFMLALPQSETETIMGQTLAAMGVRVEWGTQLRTIRPAGERAEVTLAGPRGETQDSFDLVYAADGAHSRVRDALGMGFSGYTHKRAWSIVDCEITDWPFPDAAAIASLHRTGDMGFIIPIGAKRFRAVANTPSDTLAQFAPGAWSARILQSDTFQIPVRQADTYQSGCVYLGGDAAHVHSPVGARGMNLGIEDAFVFARRFAEGTLAGYTAERHPVGRAWIRLSERLLAAAQSSNPLLIAARNLAIHTVGRTARLQGAMMQRVAGLKD